MSSPTTPSRSSTASTPGCSTKADSSEASPCTTSGGCSCCAPRCAARRVVALSATLARRPRPAPRRPAAPLRRHRRQRNRPRRRRRRSRRRSQWPSPPPRRHSHPHRRRRRPSRERRRRRSAHGEPINSQMVRAAFVVDHPVGRSSTGSSIASPRRRTSMGEAQCYVPFAARGIHHRAALEYSISERARPFTVQRFDPVRR